MEKNKKTTRQVLEDALLAVNTNIQQLVVTQGVLEDQLRLLETGEPEANPMATMGAPEVTDCEHPHVEERHTMGTSWYLCLDCKEMVDSEQVDV